VETNQLVFLLYLLLGQVVLLVLWSLVRRRGSDDAPSPRRLAQIGFAAYWLLGQVALFVGWTFLVAEWDEAGVVAAADLVVTLHFGFVLFVLGLELFILAGWPLDWAWTRNFWLRLLHLVCIEIVVGQAVVGLECPLTSVERDLRGTLMPEDPRDSEAGFAAILAGDIVGARTDSALTSAVVAVACTTTTPPWGKKGGTPYVGWKKFWRSQLHYLEGSSPVARFSHNKLFYSVQPENYPYVVAPVGLLLLLTWVFVPPRMPGQGGAKKDARPSA
jgi:hypothetical protein